MKTLLFAAVILGIWAAGVVTFGHVLAVQNDRHMVRVR